MNLLLKYFVFYVFLTFLVLKSSCVIGQKKVDTTSLIINGRVSEFGSAQSLLNASVVEVDRNNRYVSGTITDVDGRFSLSIQKKDSRISIALIGFKTLELPVSIYTQSDSVYVFRLEADGQKKDLDEVTIIGIKDKTVNNGSGLNTSKRNSTFAATTIDAKVLQEMQAASIDQALQGRLPGVDIAAISGDPGVGMQIRIRGTSSLSTGSDPLIVLDGMPYDISVSSDFNYASSDEQAYAQLLNIAPADIQDITVLKDAAATAIWGAKGANGVLVINTKRGIKSAPQVAYTFKGSYSNNPKPIPMLSGDQYSQLIPEEYMNRDGSALNTQTVKEFAYDKNDPYYYYNYSNNTNWIGAVSRSGILHDHVVSLRGGGAKAQYYASLNYYGQIGNTVGTSLDRFAARINLDYKVSDYLKFTADISYTHILNNQLYVSTLRNVAYKKMPNMSIYEYNEYGVKTANYFSPESNVQGQYPATYNPVAMANEATNKQIGDRIIPHFQVQYQIIPSILTATSDLQFDINSGNVKTFLPQIATGRPITESTVNRASDADYDGFTVATKSNLVYTPAIGEKSSFQGLLSLQTSDYNYLNQQLMSSNTASSLLQNTTSASRTQNAELSNYATNTQNRSASLLVSAQYGYDDRYLVNVGMRGDGSSRFSAKHRYGLFPSLSARWRISAEKFMKKAKWIDDLSLRLSYGQSGNMPSSDYLYYSTYSNLDWNYLGEGGTFQENIQLNNLKWETIIGKNIGMNTSLWKGALSVDIDVYRNRTKDMLYPDLSLMTYSGYSTIPYLNAGVMDNQGWEVGIFVTPLKSKEWKLEFNINLAHNENMIRSISDLYPRENVQDLTVNGVYKSMIQENNPFGSFYGYKYLGVYKDKSETAAKDKNNNPISDPNGNPLYMRFYYPTVDYVFQPGDAKYEDINHDGNIDYRDIVYLGNGNPKLTGGFGPSVTFKDRLKLALFFSFRTGYQLINNTEMYTTNMYSFDNQSTAVLRRWRRVGDVTDIPRAVYNTGYNWLGSSRYIQDASYLRLRSLTIRYDIAPELSKRIGLGSLGAYVTAENIFTWTKYRGQDPEVTTRITSPFSVAVDNSMTPPIRTITIGISARF